MGKHGAHNSIKKIDVNGGGAWESVRCEWRYDLKCSIVKQFEDELVKFGNYYDSHQMCIVVNPWRVK